MKIHSMIDRWSDFCTHNATAHVNATRARRYVNFADDGVTGEWMGRNAIFRFTFGANGLNWVLSMEEISADNGRKWSVTRDNHAIGCCRLFTFDSHCHFNRNDFHLAAITKPWIDFEGESMRAPTVVRAIRLRMRMRKHLCSFTWMECKKCPVDAATFFNYDLNVFDVQEHALGCWLPSAWCDVWRRFYGRMLSLGTLYNGHISAH